MNPSVAAMLYPGATEATLITMFETNEIALLFSPLSTTDPVAFGGVNVALSITAPSESVQADSLPGPGRSQGANGPMSEPFLYRAANDRGRSTPLGSGDQSRASRCRVGRRRNDRAGDRRRPRRVRRGRGDDAARPRRGPRPGGGGAR